MSTSKTVILGLAFQTGLACLTAAAQSAGGTAATPSTPAPVKPSASPTANWIKQIKNPTDWLSWGGDLRLRNEFVDNAITLNQNTAGHQRDYFRFRGRVFANFKPFEVLTLNNRIIAEPRQWMTGGPGTPVKGAGAGQPKQWSGNHFDWTEGIIDILNVKLSNPGDLPLTFTFGRQEIMLGDAGDWWLVADGTPLDGSRSLFFDAARLTLDLKEQKTSLDLIYLQQSAMNNTWLPPINHLDKTLTEQDERGVIAYVSNKSLAKAQIDGYFIYKGDHQSKEAVDALLGAGNTGHLYTMGGKITAQATDNIKASVEGAYQTGTSSRGSTGIYQDVSAFGIKNRLTYLFKDDLNNQIRLSHELISGDDPNTPGRNEGMDMLWGRYPRWSELYIYSYASDPRVADNGNVHRIGPGWSITPMKNLDYSIDYNAVFADQSRNAAVGNFGTGDFRGHLLRTFAKYTFNQHVSGHLWSEFLWAGDYYAKRDMFTFLRAELMFTF
jgi:hypothetical protein